MGDRARLRLKKENGIELKKAAGKDIFSDKIVQKKRKGDKRENRPKCLTKKLKKYLPAENKGESSR